MRYGKISADSDGEAEVLPSAPAPAEYHAHKTWMFAPMRVLVVAAMVVLAFYCGKVSTSGLTLFASHASVSPSPSRTSPTLPWQAHAPPELEHNPANHSSPLDQMRASCKLLKKGGVSVKLHVRGNVGNVLSEYLEGLALATLANEPFKSSGQHKFVSFLRHLPKHFPVARPHGEALVHEVLSACQSCTHVSAPMYYSCQGAWTSVHVRATLREAIHIALRAGGLHRVQEEFAAGHVVVHMRCSAFTFLSNKGAGVTAFSIFNEIPKNTTHVTIVAAEYSNRFRPCRMTRIAAKERLQNLLPHAMITELIGGVDPNGTSEDFARLVYAPVLVRGMGSFSLWSALANYNQVISPKNVEAGWSWHAVDLGQNWHWSEAPVLAPVAAARELVLPWLMQH